MIDVLLGKLSGCLTPNARMIPFRVVIGNRPADQVLECFKGLCFNKQLTPFRFEAREEGLVHRVITWGGRPRVTHIGLAFQDSADIVAAGIGAATILVDDQALKRSSFPSLEFS